MTSHEKATQLQPEESRTDDARVKDRTLTPEKQKRPSERRRRTPPFTDGPFTESKELIGSYGLPRGARR